MKVTKLLMIAAVLSVGIFAHADDWVRSQADQRGSYNIDPNMGSAEVKKAAMGCPLVKTGSVERDAGKDCTKIDGATVSRTKGKTTDRS